MEGTALPGRLTQPARLEWQPARVAWTRWETPRVRTLALQTSNWNGHHAGQHLDLRLTAEDGYQTQRSYSIASAPGAPTIEITVERLTDGEVSPYLTDVVRQEDFLEVRGPIGGYFVWEPEPLRPLALIAGGSGIVPLMCMLRYRASLGAASARVPPARLLYSAGLAGDLIYRAELDELAAASDLRVSYTLTRSRPAGWPGYRRRVDRDMLRDVLWGPTAAALFYVCGPTPMVETVATLLVELGHAPLDIRTERFGPTGGDS